MTTIHPTALVHPHAELDENVTIGPFCVLDEGCRIKSGTILRQGVYVASSTEIGRDCQVHMGVALGDEPQHLKWTPEVKSGLRIGDRNVLREYVTIHRAYHPDSNTIIGNDNYLMAMSHVGHDCVLGSNNILANSALLSGHVMVEDNVVISGNTGIHQFVRIGRLSMIGGVSRVAKDVPPFMMIVGDSEITGLNTIGLQRNGFSPEDILILRRAYKMLYRSGLNTTQALQQIETLLPNEHIQRLIEFIRHSERGIAKPAERR